MDGQEQTFQVTHPFHPLRGRIFTLVAYRHTWGEDRAYYHNEKGKLCSFPARWTSVIPAEPLVVVARGRSPFRLTDLLELSRLLKAISPEEGASEGKKV